MKNIILIIIDGCGREIFYDLLLEKRLPSFEVVAKEGAWVRYGNSVFPAETLPALTSLFTGSCVSKHGVAGNVWFDRTGKKPFIRDYREINTATGIYGYGVFGFPTLLLPLRDTTGIINKDISNNVHTIYELSANEGYSSIVLYNQFSRGATKWVRPTRKEIILSLLCYKGLISYQKMEEYVSKKAVDVLRKTPLPNIFTLYLFGLDVWGHTTDSHSQAIYLEKFLEPAFSNFINFLDKTKILDELYFVIVSDHGGTWVRKQRKIDTTILKVEIEKAGFKVHDSKQQIEDSSCVICAGGGCVHIHLKNRKENDWKVPPDFERDVVPVAEKLSKICKWRRENQKICAEGCSSVMLVRNSLIDNKYFVFSNEKIINLEDFFWSKLSDYPAVFKNIYGMNSAKSGDILMLSNLGGACYFSDNDIYRSHGSLAKDDISIPMIFSGPTIKRKVIEYGSMLDVAPTILSLLGIRAEGMDGNVLPIQ